MLCIDSRNTNPYYNLAAEEIFLKNSGEDFFMVWESESSVIVGKHQNALAEINYRFAREKNIAVARRLTGGGTVYHDRGNINFTFIRNGEPGKLVDFASFIEVVMAFLGKYGLKAVQGPKHEIMVNDRKVSGNSEHIYKTRVLHHGTLLFDSDLGMLRKSIAHTGGQYKDKAVQSNRSSVMNIIQCLHDKVDTGTFRESFFNYVMKFFDGSLYEPDSEIVTGISRLADEKYQSWDWIYGWSPDYSFTNEWKSDLITVHIELEVRKGQIISCNLQSRQADLARVTDCLNSKSHSEENVRKALGCAGLNEILNRETFEDLVYAFF